MGKIAKTDLYSDVRQLIVAARQRVAVSVNAELTMLYWNVGKRINEEVLGCRRAEYGQRVVEDLAARLTAEFGDGWTVKTLRHCLRDAETFTHEENFKPLEFGRFREEFGLNSFTMIPEAVTKAQQSIIYADRGCERMCEDEAA